MPRSRPENPRAAAIADLFTALEDLVLSYQVTAEPKREARWAADADRITGEIARHLSTARARLSPSFDPAPSADR